MGWVNENAPPGHEGYLVAVEQEGHRWREIGYPDERTRQVWAVQVACDCGWRSQRLSAPFGTEWTPYSVFTKEEFEDECRPLWHQHLKSAVKPDADDVARVKLVLNKLHGDKPSYCRGCECEVPLRGAYHEEETSIPGKVYAYPCLRGPAGPRRVTK